MSDVVRESLAAPLNEGSAGEALQLDADRLLQGSQPDPSMKAAPGRRCNNRLECFLDRMPGTLNEGSAGEALLLGGHHGRRFALLPSMKAALGRRCNMLPGPATSARSSLNEGSAGEALQLASSPPSPPTALSSLNEGSAGEALQPLDVQHAARRDDPSMKAAPGRRCNCWPSRSPSWSGSLNEGSAGEALQPDAKQGSASSQDSPQ